MTTKLSRERVEELRRWLGSSIFSPSILTDLLSILSDYAERLENNEQERAGAEEREASSPSPNEDERAEALESRLALLQESHAEALLAIEAGMPRMLARIDYAIEETRLMTEIFKERGGK